MAALTLIHYPDARLRLVAEPVMEVNDEIKQLIDDMTETMYLERGIGLAAPQVGVSKRIIIVDISETRDQPLALINPEFITYEGEMEMMDGCLSLPEAYSPTIRYENVTVRYLDKSGQQQTLAATGLLAGCLQHEIDHLNGKLFIDHLSSLKRQRIEKKVQKHTKRLAEN